MQKLSWILSTLLVLAGHGDETIKEGEKPKAVVGTELPLPDEIT